MSSPEKNQRQDWMVMILVLLLIFLITGYWFLSSQPQKSRDKKQDKVPAISELKDLKKDADHDGLSDRNEEKYQTDPNKSDTDGDGYWDGEEIASGYDPRYPAPNDKIVSSNANLRPLPQNLTRALGQQLSQNFSNQPLPTDPKEINALLDPLIKDLGWDINQIFALPTIPNDQIKISSDNNSTAQENYLKATAQIISRNSGTPAFLQPAMEEISNSFQTKNFSGLEKYANDYAKNYSELKNLTVPSDLAASHKKTLGLFWVLQNMFSAISQTNEDPLKSLLALQSFYNVLEMASKLSPK